MSMVTPIVGSRQRLVSTCMFTLGWELLFFFFVGCSIFYERVTCFAEAYLTLETLFPLIVGELVFTSLPALTRERLRYNLGGLPIVNTIHASAWLSIATLF